MAPPQLLPGVDAVALAGTLLLQRVVASSNAEWAISDYGEPNRNRILLYKESGESGTVLRLLVSEGRRGPRTPPNESRTTTGGVDTSAHTG